MNGSTTVTLLTSAVSQVGSTFSTMLPQIVPVAIVLAVVFGILHWLLGASRRR